MGDGAMDVVDVADELRGGAELVVAAKLEVDKEVTRDEVDDWTDDVDREELEVMEIEVLITLEEDDDTAAVEVEEVVEMLDDTEDTRLDMLDEEILDVEEEIADVSEVADDVVVADDDIEVESTDQTLILHEPPQI